MLRSLALALVAVVFALVPGSAFAHDDGISDEPVIPGADWVTDFQIAPNGDVYVAHHDGEIDRYARTADSTVANPSYALAPQLIYKFQTTQQTDRGLVGIAIDSQFDAGHRYLYALITHGSSDYVEQAVNGNPNGIRRTAAAVRIAVPASGPAQPSDLETIIGKDDPADPDGTCKPYTKGQAASHGETDAAPNGVELNSSNPSADPVFTEKNVYPDGDLSTKADGAYDCVASDTDTHSLGTIASATDGTLFLSMGDGTPYAGGATGAAFRAYNLESYNGKILHVDRSGRGVADHPLCSSETDLTQICTKLWIIGLRNAFRFNLLPPDGGSRGEPAIAVGDVGNFTVERLTVAHPGENLGWPCWEGSYWNYAYASPSQQLAPRTLWGGPALAPSGSGHSSCERLTSTGADTGANVKPSSDITFPDLEYFHDQTKNSTGGESAAIVGGPQLAAMPGADPHVALPSAWTGSLFFTDFARGWVYRIAPDASDPGNADRDGGLRWPTDDPARTNSSVRTDVLDSGEPIDPLLDEVADPAPLVPDPSAVPSPEDPNPVHQPYYRLTLREGPDGTLWYLRYTGASSGGGIYRLRTQPAAVAKINSADGVCTRDADSSGNVILSADDAGAGAAYSWDLNGDGKPDSSRTTRTITIAKADLKQVALTIRMTVKSGGDQSVDACYFSSGTPPDVTITSPAKDAQVVLGKPITVTAYRPVGDAEASGIPDSELVWQATTVHGSSHEHALAYRASPFETVNGVKKMQFTITPTPTHELGSYTRVRIFAPTSDVNTAAQTIRIYPKPVTTRLVSAPAGADITLANGDTEARHVSSAPSVSDTTSAGRFATAAGSQMTLAAQPTFTDSSGVTWNFTGWSDGQTGTTHAYFIPDNGGDAPVAQFKAQAPPTTPYVKTTPDIKTTPYVPTTPYVQTTPYVATTPYVKTTPYVPTTPYVKTTPSVETTPFVKTTPFLRTTPYVDTTPYTPTTPYTVTTPSPATTPLASTTPYVVPTTPPPVIATTPLAATPIATTPAVATTAPPSIAPTVPNAGGPSPPVIPPPAPIVLPLTTIEIKQAPLTLLTTSPKKRAVVEASLSFARVTSGDGLAVKAAVRSKSCQWWSFSRKRFLGPSRTAQSARVRKAAARRCTKAPSWKLVTATWNGRTVTATVPLGGALRPGVYAVRLRVQRGTKVLAERTRALRIR